MNKKKGKRKLKWRSFLYLFFILMLIFIFFWYLFSLNIKNIIITGTYYLKDNDIIAAAELKNYPSLFRTSNKTLIAKIKSLDYVKQVQIKKSIFGRLTIHITENQPLFYHRDLDVFVLSNEKKVQSQNISGVPILINYVPDEIYARFMKEILKTDSSILKLISEIEYQPWKSDEIIIDDTRFFLRMNDGNSVYVNLINWDKLNNYMTIYSTLGDSKGTLQLDSSLGNGITFTPYQK